MNSTEYIPTRWWRLALSGKQTFLLLAIHLETSKWCFTGLLCAKQWLNLNFSKDMWKYKVFYKEIAEEQTKKNMCSRKKADILTTCHMWCLGKQKGGYNFITQRHGALPAQAADWSNPTHNLQKIYVLSLCISRSPLWSILFWF